MKIVFTGGGTGGHFYPIIAVAEAVREIVKERKLLEPELYFFGPTAFDDRALYENGITFVATPSGKIRRYFSLLNAIDFIKLGFGIVRTWFSLYRLFPDVVFSKGGYGSVPTLICARALGIPVFIHDSDAVPGTTTLFSAKFAKKIAISYEETFEQFPENLRKKIALTGNPVRRDILNPAREGAKEFLELEDRVQTILVLGGSLGAETINNTILEALPILIENYQIVHQTGRAHIKAVSETAHIILETNALRYRYKTYDYLSPLALKMASGAADLVISRAGSGSIAEIASWKKPSILVPIPETISRDQRSNAYAYARTGAATVMEQQNLAPNLLVAEVQRILKDPKIAKTMSDAASGFAKPDAAHVLADALVTTALEHVE